MPTKKIFDIYPPKTIDKKEGVKKAKSKEILGRKKRASSQLKKNLAYFGSKKIFIICLGTLIVIVFLHFSARAEIEIWPKTEILSFEKDLIIDVNSLGPNFQKNTIPGQFFSEIDELSQEFSSSGILIKETKATGVILVFNEYNLPQILVKNTRFLSAGGKLFYSQEYVNIPSGQNRDVSVIAAKSGPEYNVKPTTYFSLPALLGSSRYTAVYGKSFSQIEVGAITQVSQVSKEDLAQAESTILDKLRPRLKEKLNNRAGNLFVLLEQAIETTVLEKSASKKEGEEAEKFDFFIKANVKGLGFQESSIKDFAQKWILEQIPESKEIKAQSLTQEYIFKKLDIQEGKMYLKVKISAEIFTSIDEQGLKDALSGKSIKESMVLLESNQEIEKTKIRLFPFWLKKIPEDISRIRVKVNLAAQ